MQTLLERLGGEAVLWQTLTLYALVLARVAPLGFLAPWIALRDAPVLVRSATMLALTAALAPLAAASAHDLPGSVFPFGVAVVRELATGALFAVAAALPFWALDWAGHLIDTWRGASLAEVLAPPTGERTSPLGNLYLLLGVVIFLALGGHRLALEAFVEGLSSAPVGAPVAVHGLGQAVLGGARLTGDALAFAVALAAPAAAALVLVELALGLVARAAPQVPVFFAGMPLRAGVGLAAALLGLAILVGRLPGAFHDALGAASGLLRMLGT